jgi:acyl carrier protein
MVTNASDARLLLEGVLHRISPGVDLRSVDPEAQLLDVANLDSLDFIAMIDAVRHATGIEIPARDYPAVATVAGFVDYLVAAARVQ